MLAPLLRYAQDRSVVININTQTGSLDDGPVYVYNRQCCQHEMVNPTHWPKCQILEMNNIIYLGLHRNLRSNIRVFAFKFGYKLHF